VAEKGPDDDSKIKIPILICIRRCFFNLSGLSHSESTLHRYNCVGNRALKLVKRVTYLCYVPLFFFLTNTNAQKSLHALYSKPQQDVEENRILSHNRFHSKTEVISDNLIVKVNNSENSNLEDAFDLSLARRIHHFPDLICNTNVLSIINLKKEH
jgi:hypothetical protein